MGENKSWLELRLEQAGHDRRTFLEFCGTVAAYFALPKEAGAEIAGALVKSAKPTLVWLEFQDCCGNTEAFLRAERPSAADIILDVLSVDYHETIMAAAGAQSEKSLHDVVEKLDGKYLVVVEGSIPTGEGGAYCTIAGRSALEIAREVCGHAAGTIALGTCAAFGGLPAASPNPTGALGVGDAVPKIRNLINLSACPANGENLTALVVHFLTYGRWPELDAEKRPLFAQGKTIHDNCERRAHFDAAQYVESWGDKGHIEGYCLFKMGCKGPVAYNNCPVIRWNAANNWPIGCGHPCLGCSEPDFWDRMTPFYQHLPTVPGFNVGASIDEIGAGAAGAMVAAFSAHGLVHLGKRRREHRVPNMHEEIGEKNETEGGDK